MFAFLMSEHRGSEPSPLHKHTADPTTIPSSALPLADSRPALPRVITTTKRNRDVGPADCHGLYDTMPPVKRARVETTTPRLSQPVAKPGDNAAMRLDDARDVIRHQFGLDILLKHTELRRINQELAKCEMALEQLRRCHLIPYPSDCPTPDQMLDIGHEQGPALADPTGAPIPRWAPPFGVIDGPYARHYAKWLIPDPCFDKITPANRWLFNPPARGFALQGRTTRNGLAEPRPPPPKARRHTAGPKLHALSGGHPQVKDKSGPCVLKRTDGNTVKLVCVDCHRENFSSTQGFINHCRIAHRRDFKSHEEAAVVCGQVVDAAAIGPSVAVEKPAAPAPAPVSAPTPNPTPVAYCPPSVHPFARHDMSEQSAFSALCGRIEASLKLYHAGRLPGIGRIPSASEPQGSPIASCSSVDNAEPVPETPHLSRMMQSRNFAGSLRDLVSDAKTKVPLDDMPADDDESDEGEVSTRPPETSRGPPKARMSVVVHIPAGGCKSAASSTACSRPASSKGRLRDVPLPYASDDVATTTHATHATHASHAVSSDEEMEDLDEADLSPTTLISNNAPSLVSDDGEYDDTDEGSSVSGEMDPLEGTPVSDVAEITIDDDHEPRALRRGSSGGTTGPVKLRRDDAKQVSIVSPMKNRTRQRQPLSGLRQRGAPRTRMSRRSYAA